MELIWKLRWSDLQMHKERNRLGVGVVGGWWRTLLAPILLPHLCDSCASEIVIIPSS